MSRTREVYLLDPQIYSPETIAVAFAKTSRSPESFGKIADELTGESSKEFNEKWVVGYGHSSVAEHAVLHIALENISRLAVECLESNRLASYTEKSTRYQQWTGEDFHIPTEFADKNSREIFLDICRDLFRLYESSLPVVVDSLEKDTPIRPDETPARRKRIILTAAGDVCRFLLPVSAFANVGMTINARALEHAITKMLSHPLHEVRLLGKEVKEISQKALPTLLKYASEQPSLTETARFFQEHISSESSTSFSNCVPGAKLIRYEPDLVDQVLQAAILRYHGRGYAQCSQIIHSLSADQKKEWFQSIFSNLSDHDIPIRELEYGNFVFEVILDEGAYLELKRHRMMTQTPAPFTPRLGYAVPRQFEKAGLLDEYDRIMIKAGNAYESLASISRPAASYVLPNAYNRQVLIQSNFRSMYHFLALRSAPNAHFSIRRIAHQMADQLMDVLPVLSDILKLDRSETVSEIEGNFFSRV